jgi:hypothetical protein
VPIAKRCEKNHGAARNGQRVGRFSLAANAGAKCSKPLEIKAYWIYSAEGRPKDNVLARWAGVSTARAWAETNNSLYELNYRKFKGSILPADLDRGLPAFTQCLAGA